MTLKDNSVSKLSVTAARYKNDLLKAEDFFQAVREWADSKALNTDELSISSKINIRKVPLVPLSMTFVDPYDKGGFLVLIPNAYEARNISRPCFVISRAKNEDIFQQYWGSYEHKFTE